MFVRLHLWLIIDQGYSPCNRLFTNCLAGLSKKTRRCVGMTHSHVIIHKWSYPQPSQNRMGTPPILDHLWAPGPRSCGASWARGRARSNFGGTFHRRRPWHSSFGRFHCQFTSSNPRPGCDEGWCPFDDQLKRQQKAVHNEPFPVLPYINGLSFSIICGQFIIIAIGSPMNRTSEHHPVWM